MKRMIALMGLMALMLSCQAGTNGQAEKVGPNMLTKAEIADGWILLWDGKSFDGWRGLNREDVPEGHWRIEDNSIHKIAQGEVPVQADGQPVRGGDLMTKETFQNYEFSFEWNVAPGANSGIKYNVDESMSRGGGALGFEYQVIDDGGHADGAKVTHQAGDLYEIYSSNDQKMLKPVGEWNHGKIVFDGNRGEHWLNGKKIVEYELGSEDFAERFAKSKYTRHEGFADRKKGHIVLQDHNDAAWYRNLKLKVLP